MTDPKYLCLRSFKKKKLLKKKSFSLMNERENKIFHMMCMWPRKFNFVLFSKK